MNDDRNWLWFNCEKWTASWRQGLFFSAIYFVNVIVGKY